MKVEHIFSIVFMFAFLVGCSQNKFQYKPISTSKYYSETSYLELYEEEIKNLSQQGYPIENSLPKEYVEDGSVDYTKYIQKAIDEHSNIVFPPFPILINDNGISIHSNCKVLFKKGSLLVMKPSTKANYQLIKIWKAANVKLFYPNLKGDRKSHLGKHGEWGMGININNSTNVILFAPKIKECWGDGLYISGSNNPSRNIKVYNGFFDYNRRNGISIINAKNLQLYNIICSNTYGTNPMSGIDIEPNKNTNYIDSLYLKNIYTINNFKVGLKIQLRKLLKSNSRPITNIHVINHFSNGSEVSCMLTPVKKIPQKFSGFPTEFKGEIKIENPYWVNFRRKSLGVWEYGQLGPNVIVISPKIEKNTNKIENLLKDHGVYDKKYIQEKERLRKKVKKQTKIIIN